MVRNTNKISGAAADSRAAAAQSATAASPPGDGPKNSANEAKGPAGVWVAISAALVVVVAILAALGIEEDFLRRMVRNDPQGIARSIGFVMVGASLPVVLLLLRLFRGGKRQLAALTAVVAVASALLVVLGMINVLRAGADSLHSRDMPGLQLSVAKSSNGAVIITAEATAASLRSNEKMLLRLYGVGSSASDETMAALPCLSSQELNIYAPQTGSGVLQWGETGPDKTGTAKISESLVVDGTKFSFVCAYAVLLNVQPGEPYFSRSVVDLRSLAPAATVPTPTATTAPAATP